VTPPRRLTSKELEPYGNLAINLPEALRKPGGGDDILVVDGDTINIPETPTMIPAVGAVVVSVGVPYLPGKNLGYYIAHAGGFAPDAATDRIVVIHAGGGLEPDTGLAGTGRQDEVRTPIIACETFIELPQRQLLVTTQRGRRVRVRARGSGKGDGHAADRAASPGSGSHLAPPGHELGRDGGAGQLVGRSRRLELDPPVRLVSRTQPASSNTALNVAR